MKRTAIIISLVLAFSGMSAFAEPLGLTAGLEADSGDLLSDDDFYLELDPSLFYTVGETGFTVGATWTRPLLPDSYTGSIEFEEEYDFSAAGVDFAIINDNNLYIDPDADTDGCLNLDATWKFVNGGFDVTYTPDYILDAYVGPTWSMAIGSGSLDLSASLYFLLYQKDVDADLGDLEGTVGYTFPVGPLSLTAELDPTYTLSADDDAELEMTALISASYSF